MYSFKKCTFHVGKRNPSRFFFGELCAPTGIFLSTQKQCWEVTQTVTCLPSLSHQKVTLHWHSSLLPQTTGVYSCFKQSLRTQKAQDNAGTLSKEYLNRAPWNLFTSIQERLIKESLPENRKLSWMNRKSRLPEEKAWALQPTQKYSVVPRPSYYLLNPQITPDPAGVLFKHTTSSKRHWRQVFQPVSGRFQPVINVTSTKAPADLNCLVPSKKTPQVKPGSSVFKHCLH